MSESSKLRGREYLTAVRPEAMNHLLAFFKEAGRNLDPKTRFLISVLKQVVNFSPRGLKQYIKRAVQEGATRDEILDVILLAYPLANLTKLADAVDVMLDMDLPQLREPTPEQWHAVDPGQVPAEGACSHVVVAGRTVLLSRRNGKLSALDSQCPHRGGNLSQGPTADGTVTCPLHGWSFKLEDGSSAGRGMGGATVIPVREVEGRVELEIEAKPSVGGRS